MTNCGWNEMITVVETKIPFGFNERVRATLHVSKASSMPEAVYSKDTVGIDGDDS